MTPIQSLILKAVCINVPIYILLLGPKDAVLKYIWAHRHDAKSSLRMWHYETLAVCALVAAVVLLSGSDPVEWVGFAALTLAHGRNSVMFRLTEAQQRSSPVDPHHVECWRWNTIYFLLAECFWAGYFVLHRSWAALAGVAIFVGYGQWRRWYGRRADQRVRWEGIDPDLQKRAIQKELGIDAMGSCFFCGSPQLYWMRLNYAKDGAVTASKRVPVCSKHGPPSHCPAVQLTHADIKQITSELKAQSQPTEEVACIKCSHIDRCYVIGDGPRLPYVCATCLDDAAEWLKNLVPKEVSVTGAFASKSDEAPTGFEELPIDLEKIGPTRVRIVMGHPPSCGCPTCLQAS